MSEKFGSATEIGLYPREESEKKKWDKIKKDKGENARPDESG